MHSCIYEGIVTHSRRRPVEHWFQYRLFMVLLDLAELPALCGPGKLIADRKLAGRSFLRGDHLFDPTQSLESEIRGIVGRQTGSSPHGPVRLLTQLRYFGYYFSPLNLYYVFDKHDQHVECVVAEVNNTPWKERHCYVLWEQNQTSSGATMAFEHQKELHVSPFMDMDQQYRWQLSQPGAALTVQLDNIKEQRKLFSARMSLDRRPLDRSQLRRMMWRYSLMTAQITSAIYLQALKLWWKKCPFYSHPKKRRERPTPQPKAQPTQLTARNGAVR